MRIIACVAVLTMLFLMATASAKVYRVGVSPLVLDMGDVERGTSVAGTFYIVSSSPDEFLVNLKASPGNVDTFQAKFGEHLQNYSEQDSSAWISFLQNPVVLKHGDVPEGAANIKSSKAISFLLNVPKDAEPGRHSSTIIPEPSVPSGAGGGAVVVAQTAMTLVFNVPGEAVREGVVLDVTPGSRTEKRVELNVFFENTGDVTIYPSASIELYDEYGNLDIVNTEKKYVKPGEMTSLKAFLELKEIEGEEFQASVTASYLTGFATKDTSLNIFAPPETTAAPEPVEEEGFPWGLLLIPVILVAVYIYYKRE